MKSKAKEKCGGRPDDVSIGRWRGHRQCLGRCRVGTPDRMYLPQSPRSSCFSCFPANQKSVFEDLFSARLIFYEAMDCQQKPEVKTSKEWRVETIPHNTDFQLGPFIIDFQLILFFDTWYFELKKKKGQINFLFFSYSH